MKRLYFLRHFVDPVLGGTKTTTLRRSSCRMKPGDTVEAVAKGKKFALLVIDSVEPMALDDLRPSDAASDGFDTVAEMKEAVSNIYPDGTTGYVMLRFHLGPAGEASSLPPKSKGRTA